MPTGEIISALVNMGSAGAVILVVYLFLRDRKEANAVQAAKDEAERLAQEKRDRVQASEIENRNQQWRDFFIKLNDGSAQQTGEISAALNRVVETIGQLLEKLQEHDAKSSTEFAHAIDKLEKHDENVANQVSIAAGVKPAPRKRIS